MIWLEHILSIDADTTKGRLLLLVIDKVLIALIVGIAFIIYDRYRTSDSQRFQRELVAFTDQLETERRELDIEYQNQTANIQREFEKARLSKELLPHILDKDVDVVARSYLLSSALSTELIDGLAALDVAATLIAHGAAETQIKRIAQLVLPDGLEAIASHAARLQEQASKLGMRDLSLQVTATIDVLGERSYAPAATLPKELQNIQRERLLWASVLRDTLPNVAAPDEEGVVTRDFIAKHISSFYFLVGSDPELFQSPSKLLRLVGALNCVIGDWGQKVEAVDYLELRFESLDLSSINDIRYALALVNAMREHGQGSSAQSRRIAPGISRQLAKLLVDGSFFHRVSWIESDASSEQRERWFDEEAAAGAHSSMQLAAGEVLLLMGKRVKDAEGILVSFMEDLVERLEKLEKDEEIMLLSSRYGSHSVRAAARALVALNSQDAILIMEKLKRMDRRKLAAFEGIAMELSHQ